MVGGSWRVLCFLFFFWVCVSLNQFKLFSKSKGIFSLCGYFLSLFSSRRFQQMEKVHCNLKLGNDGG